MSYKCNWSLPREALSKDKLTSLKVLLIMLNCFPSSTPCTQLRQVDLGWRKVNAFVHKIILETFYNTRKLLTFCKLSLFTPALSPFWVSRAGVFYYPVCLLPSCLVPGALWWWWGSGIIARQLPSSTDPHNHARPDQNIRSDILYDKWYDISVPYDLYLL